MIARKIFFTIFLFPVCAIAQQDSVFFQADSVRLNKSADSLIVDDEYLIEGTYMLLKDFQFRVVSNLITQRETYNENMNRIDNDTRVTTANLSLQGWLKVNNKVNIGMNASLRAFKTGGYASSPLDVYDFSSDSTSKTVFRSFSPIVKILLYDGKFRLAGQSTFIIPVSKAFDLTYDENIFRDPNQAQWTNQLLYVKKYSKYFSLKLEMVAILRLGQTEGTRGFTLRMPVTPVFNYSFNSKLLINAYMELNPVIVEGFFSSFNFRETIGFAYYLNNNFSLDFLFTYVALGIKAPAQKFIALGTRISF